MQMTTEARTWLDATVRRILARQVLGDAERAGLTYELMSHLHGAAEAHATAAGRTEVATEDLARALADAGGEDGLAQAFVSPFARPMQRVLFWRRLGAYAIDTLLLGIALSFLHGVLTLVLAGGGDGGAAAGMEDHDGALWFGFSPWGFHDLGLPAWVQIVIAGASAFLVVGYFTWLEAHEGRTLGKRALGLRVVRTDGQPLTYRESFLRNLVKVSPALLMLDTLVMLVAFSADKQRVSDRFANTVVVRA